MKALDVEQKKIEFQNQLNEENLRFKQRVLNMDTNVDPGKFDLMKMILQSELNQRNARH